MTCPTTRIHPAIVAHAAATAAVMLDGRFFLGVGTGENLNEHILGDRWPEIPIRQDWSDFDDGQRAHHESPVSWWSFVGSSTFWESTFQNWQSEFLAVGSFVVLTVYLRQRGSPESKPVGAAHDATGVEG